MRHGIPRLQASVVGERHESAFNHALDRLGLERLIPLLDTTHRWDRELSQDEQLCLAIARMLLQSPPWVLIDGTFGALDDNIDGKLSAAEFRNDPRFKPIVGYLSMVDADKDNALSKAEMANALQMLRKMREQRVAPQAPKEDAGAAAMRQNATGETR